MVTKIKQSGIADLAVGQGQLAADSVTATKIVDGAVGAPEIGTNAVGTDEVQDGAITASDLAATLNLSSKTITLPPANTPALTKSFESTQQTITAAGALTLAHGLGVKPKLIQLTLVCATAEFGYLVGDEADLIPASGTTADRGVSVVRDATNVLVRFGNAAASLIITNKGNGNSVGLTNANWRLVVRAWA